MNSESNSSVEQERYLSAIVASTPLSTLRNSGAAWGLSDSSLSINSLLLAADEDILSPDISRRYYTYLNYPKSFFFYSFP